MDETTIIKQPEFGVRLRSRRIERGLSQKALAGELMTPSYVSLIEHGRRVPSLDVVIRLARLLDTPLRDLIGQDIGPFESTALTSPVSGPGSDAEIRRLTEFGAIDGARSRLEAKLDRLSEEGSEAAVLDTGLQLADTLLICGAHADRLAVLERLAGLSVVAELPAVRLSLAVDRASTLRELGRLREAKQCADEAVRLLGASGPPATPEQVRVLGLLASVLSGLGEDERTATVVRDMMAAAIEVGHPSMIGRANWVASMAFNRMGRQEEAYAHLQAARQALAYENMPLRDWLRFCRFTAAILLDTGRDLDAARKWIEIAELTAAMTDLTAETTATMRERARYELAIGNTEAAARLYGTLVDQSASGGERIESLLGLAEALARTGDTTEAIERLREVAAACETTGDYRTATSAWRRIDQLRQQEAGGAHPPAKPAARRGRAPNKVPAAARKRGR